MEENSRLKENACSDNCREARSSAGKIMAVLGLIIVAMAWYIISNGILEKAFL